MLSAAAPDALSSSNWLDTPDISLRQMPTVGMINLRGQVDDAAFVEICGRIVGLPLPILPNRFVSAGGRHCLWQGPDEWLIIDADNEPDNLACSLDAALADIHHAVTDVSGNRVTLRLSGNGAIELLSAGCSLDLGIDALPRGTVVQTILARTPVTIMRLDDVPTFDLLVRRSLAQYLQAWLVNAAGSVGIRYDG
jgi:sarcosine oxidase subunit gamma